MAFPDHQNATHALARNVRRWRQERGMSLSALAREAGIAKSTLSDLERGDGNPSLDTLWSLAKALSVPLPLLLDEGDPRPPIEVVHLKDAPVVRAEGLNFVSQHLLRREGTGQLELHLISLDPGTRRTAAAHALGLIEHVIVADGTVEVGPVVQPRRLAAGDIITFAADQPHCYAAIGDTSAQLIVIHEYPRTRG